MKTLQLTFISILFIISCGESLIEEISESYPNGKPKLIQYYKKSGTKQNLIMDKYFYDNGLLYGKVNYKEGKKVDFIQKNRNGMLQEEGIYEDGKKQTG